MELSTASTEDGKRRVDVRSLGLDLAGSEKRDSGLAVLDEELSCWAFTVRLDSEIIRLAEDLRPDIVVIDAPLSLPRGRKSIEDRSGPHFRACDLELRRMGIRFFPITLGPMRMLTSRGIKLSNRLSAMGLKVIESYPGGVQDVLGIPRKRDLRGLVDGLKRLGLRGCPENLNEHEADAATIAYLGILYMKGEAIGLGDPEEGLLFLPRAKNKI
ncbi:MAG: DUF429 domain-containing protein [Nitrososphaeria archaeon]